MYSIGDCKIINLHADHSESFTSVCPNPFLPFVTKRVYYIYNLSSDSERGGHAHINLKQFVVPIKGSCNIVLNDGQNKCTHVLREPTRGLFISPGIWRTIDNIEQDSVILVLASDVYNESDYIRHFPDFIRYKND